MTDEACKENAEKLTVSLPEPGINTANHASIRVIGYTADQLRAYGDERERRAVGLAMRELHRVAPWSLSNDMDAIDEYLCGIGLLEQTLADWRTALARVAELESLLKMIAGRAYSFPDFQIGWHIPEVFKAVGMEMPRRPDTDDTHDGLRARIAEIEAKLKDSEDIQFAMLGLIADIRKAAGDQTGKLMQAELVELIGRQREECDKAKEAEESDFESMEMYRRARDRADRITAAARAVVDRWETPLWKDAPATAGFIYALRDAIAEGGRDGN